MKNVENNIEDLTPLDCFSVNSKQISIPDLDNTVLEKLNHDSEKYYSQFSAISKISRYDKFAICDNKLYLQKISPWRYIVRKYKNQNRVTLAVYLNTEIIKYIEFLHELCNTAKIYRSNKELHNICIKQFEFIQEAIQPIKFLRDKYNMKSDAQSISMALECWYLKLIKIKPLLIEEISNKR